MDIDTKKVQGEIKTNIINMFGINKLPKEEQEEAVTRVGKIVFQMVLMRILPTLNEEDSAEYDKLITENREPDELLGFFYEKVPGFLQIVEEESENFKKDAEDMMSKVATS